MERIKIDAESQWKDKPCCYCASAMAIGDRGLVIPFSKGTPEKPECLLEPWHVNCFLHSCGIDKKLSDGGPQDPEKTFLDRNSNED